MERAMHSPAKESTARVAAKGKRMQNSVKSRRAAPLQRSPFPWQSVLSCCSGRLGILPQHAVLTASPGGSGPGGGTAVRGDDGAPNPGYADGWLKAAFVPRGKPRGPPGGFPKQSPVPEPGPDARGAGGAESSPASQLSARTEAPATRTGPGGWKVAWEDGRYSTGLSHLLTRIMKTAAREADGEPVHRAASQQGSRLTPPVQLGGTEATHTTGAPGVEDEGRATEGPVLLKYCLALLAAALVVSMLAATITCCLLLRRWRQRNRRLAAADGAQRDVRGHSLPSDGRPALLKGPGSWR